LNNPSLIEKFYPSDLPEDWRLGYYGNEFRLILVTLSDLDTGLSMAGDSWPLAEGSLSTADDFLPEVEDSFSKIEDSVTRLSNTISELVEEITGDDFMLLVDLSVLPEPIVKALLEHKPGLHHGDVKNVYFINLKNAQAENITQYPFTLQWGRTLNSDSSVATAGGNLVCYVTDNQIIEPIALKNLIERICNHATSEGIESAAVIFSSVENALENCRNAILLESMM